jgi:acyl-CoA thioester hydrolase
VKPNGRSVMTGTKGNGSVQGGEAFVWPARVYYEDTDAGGVVFHARYVHFLERARTEWLRSLGFEQSNLTLREKVVFAVSKLALDFRRPAYLDDLLSVGVELADTGRASLMMRQTITRGEDAILTAEVKLVCVDSERFRPTSIPEPIARAFAPSCRA